MVRADAFTKGLEIWQMVVLLVPVFAGGTLAAYVVVRPRSGQRVFSLRDVFRRHRPAAVRGRIVGDSGLGRRLTRSSELQFANCEFACDHLQFAIRTRH